MGVEHILALLGRRRAVSFGLRYWVGYTERGAGTRHLRPRAVRSLALFLSHETPHFRLVFPLPLPHSRCFCPTHGDPPSLSWPPDGDACLPCHHSFDDSERKHSSPTAAVVSKRLSAEKKLPKMKYAGYVDERTGLPIIRESPQSLPRLHGHDGGPPAQRAVVAKQRVKGHGGKSCIIEEMDSCPSRRPGIEEENSLASPETVLSRVESTRRAGGNARLRIELFIGGSEQGCMPLFDFLKLASDREGIVPPGQPSFTLRGIIKSPELKPRKEEEENIHESQLLNAPIPYDIATFVQGMSGPDAVDDRGWVAIAKANASSTMGAPTVDLSPFLLCVSMGDAKTECILPFPVDNSRQTTITYNIVHGELEIHMPLLRSSLHLEHGPDPGTPQYKIQNALSGGKSGDAIDGSACSDIGNATKEVMIGSYFLDGQTADEDIVNETRELPEDLFHSQDVLSRHLLQQREDKREIRCSANDKQSRDKADAESVDDFRPKPPKGTAAVGVSMSNDLVMGLV